MLAHKSPTAAAAKAAAHSETHKLSSWQTHTNFFTVVVSEKQWLKELEENKRKKRKEEPSGDAESIPTAAATAVWHINRSLINSDTNDQTDF